MNTKKAWSLNISAAAQWNSGLVNIHHRYPPALHQNETKRETALPKREL